MHILVAEAGSDPTSRYLVLVALRVEQPGIVAQWLARGAGDAHLAEVLRGWASQVRICFAEKSRIADRLDGWAYSFLRSVADYAYGDSKEPHELHVPDGSSLEYDGLDAFLGGHEFRPLRIRAKSVARDEPYLALVEHVARVFHAAIEADPETPSPARARYDRIAPLVDRIEDEGRNVRYALGRTTTLDLIPTSLRGRR